MLAKIKMNTRSGASLLVELSKSPNAACGANLPEPWDKVAVLPEGFSNETPGALLADVFTVFPEL